MKFLIASDLHGSKYYLDQIDEQEIIDIYYNNYCSHEADKKQIVNSIEHGSTVILLKKDVDRPTAEKIKKEIIFR